MGREVPRFYFNLCNGSEFAEDEDGIDLEDFAAARRAAVASLRDVMAGDLLMGDLNIASFIEIEDADHDLLDTVFFDAVVKVRSEPHLRQDDPGGRNGGKLP